ncbi:unknown protein [Seminavis robusta]|uniref:Transmembrane protein n=1 Tax=Seminavis robusta TaxID=568900 RepID=A0A9N8H4U5_9STRA|nr:unknown protein [Seminavis robusta]|eukprot:Sro123_g059770.1 n/a (150) ;mRNA; f:110554-111003
MAPPPASEEDPPQVDAPEIVAIGKLEEASCNDVEAQAEMHEVVEPTKTSESSFDTMKDFSLESLPNNLNNCSLTTKKNGVVVIGNLDDSIWSRMAQASVEGRNQDKCGRCFTRTDSTMVIATCLGVMGLIGAIVFLALTGRLEASNPDE